MSRIAVQPGQLAAGAAAHAGVAGRLQSLVGALESASSSCAGAAGDPGLSGAVECSSQTLALSLNGLATSVQQLSGALGAASMLYQSVDANAMGGGE